MSTVNNMQIQDDEGNVFHPETSIEQIVGENGTQVFPGGKPGNMESSDMTTAFTESKMRENIKSGEKHRVLFGKIQKFFTDLKTVAFSGKYGDLSERPTLGGAAGYKVADNDTTNSSEFLPTARVAYEHGQEIDALSRDLGGCSFEQEGDNFYVVGADAVRKKLGSSGIGGTLETVAVRDRTVMTRNYIFNNTGDYVSLVLNVKTPPNGGNANSVTVYGTAIGTSTYKQIQKITTLNADVTVNIKGYDHIKLAVTASHSGNVGHSYEATTITTYALS